MYTHVDVWKRKHFTAIIKNSKEKHYKKYVPCCTLFIIDFKPPKCNIKLFAIAAKNNVKTILFKFN